MTLDPYQGDAEMRRRAAALERADSSTAVPRRFAVALGPNSPLLERAPAATQPKRKRPNTTLVEHQIQVALFDWANHPDTLRRYPELATFYAIPNGGHRLPAVAAKLKAEGVKAGVLDTHLPVGRGGFHSLYIEIKRPGAPLTPEQPHWLAGLARYGNKVAIHTTWEDARDELLDYLALPAEGP